MEYFITVSLAFIVAFSATPIARKISFKLGAVDTPHDNRRMHKKPLARLGGLAIISGFLVSILFYSVSTTNIFTPNNEFLGLLAGILIIVVMGIIDDVRQLGPKVKLLFQLAAALAVVLISDTTRISVITNPFSETSFTQLSDLFSYPLTILWIIAITNALNLIDGLDGLAAGVASISSFTLFFISVTRTDINAATVVYTGIITAALAGSALGFLPFNFYPAKIIMGDTGSTFLGFTLGVITIQGTLKSYAAISIAIPVLILGIPLLETASSILRRLIRGKPIMTADRGHLHHRLIDMGLTHKQSVIVMYTASAALGLCAIVLSQRGVVSAVVLLVCVSLFIVMGTKYMKEISNEKEDEVKSNNIDDHNKSTTEINTNDIKDLENP